MSRVDDLIALLRSLNVNIWVDGENLRLKAPANSISPELKAEIAAYKAEIIAFLRQAGESVLSIKNGVSTRARPERLPLSFAQERLWFLHQLKPDSPMYNIPIVFRLHGSLNMTAIEDALSAVIARHESLRTVFASVEGHVYQEVKAPQPFFLQSIDLQEKSDSEWREWARVEADRPFDLMEGPLMRGALIKIAPNQFILFLNLHHIITDEWSINILLREISEGYAAFVKSEKASLPELPLQYADFTLWQREWMQGETLNSQMNYWRRILKNVPTAVTLPTYRPRLAMQTYRGATREFSISTELIEKFKVFSTQHGVTLFMSLLAVFEVLLYRYSNQTEFMVGTPIANRAQAEVEDLIGFFVNTLALPADLSNDPAFLDLLQRVREVSLGAYTNQDLPFEKVVDDLHVARDLSRNALFEVMFVLQTTAMSSLNLPGIESQEEFVSTSTSKFDLTFSVNETAHGYSVSIEYNTDLFEADTIEYMAGHYQQILLGVLADPQQKISLLPVLTDNERQKLLKEWNDTAVNFPSDLCLHQLFEAQAKRTPDAVAVMFEDRHMTYRELNESANQLARHLQKMGVGSGVLVGISIKRSLEMLVGLYGILKSGGAYLPLDPTYPPERLAFMLEDSAVKMLLTQENLTSVFQEDIKLNKEITLLCIDRDWAQISLEAVDNSDAQITSANLAYVIYTSGSTGKPKGVEICHQNVVNFLTAMENKPGITSQDTLLAITTLSFDIAALELFLPLSVGAKLVIAPREATKDGYQLDRLLKQTDATLMQATPVTWHLLLASGWIGKPNLRVLCGGETLSRRLAEDLIPICAELWNMYGPTETTIWSTIERVTVKRISQPIPIGRPIANNQIYLLNQNMQPAPIGVAGDLYIGGMQLSRGYLNRAELTAERFVANPFGAGRLYKTGDLARYLPDGNIEYIGRADQQVKVRGFRIELGEIESTLAQHDVVSQAVVIAQVESTGQKRLVAYIKVHENTSVNKDETVTNLQNYLKQKLPEYMTPSIFILLDEFPLTPNGKIDRKALPEPNNVLITGVADFAPPQTPTEQILADIWADLLGVQRVGRHDNFFDLGGHSLLATHLIFRVRRAFQTEVPLYRFFENPSIAGLAAVMDGDLSDLDALEKNRDSLANIQLDDAIQPNKKMQALRSLDSVFLTGATGFLGVYLLSELLQRPKTIVYCLVRAADVATAREKLFAQLVRHELWQDEYTERIHIIIGDIAQENLGMQPAQFSALAEKIDSIVHCAAWVNFVFPYKSLKPANVLGTQTIIRLATLSSRGVLPVHYISTLSVFDSIRYAALPFVDEQTEPEFSPHLKGGYAQSKWAAEKLVMQARSRGIPVTIHRPGIISGSSQSGIWNTHDYFPLFIKGCIQLGAIPEAGPQWRLASVDYASKAIVHLISQPDSVNRAFHYVSPQVLHHPSIAEWLRRASFAVDLLDADAWQARLKSVEHNPAHALYSLMSFLVSDGKSAEAEPIFSVTQAEQGLSGTDIVCPPVDETLFSKYLAGFIRGKFI